MQYLYKQDEYFEFVFSVEYKTTNIFGKEKIKHTHWHPQDFFEASDDLDKFMSNIGFEKIANKIIENIF